jgi:hypothetical protein
MQVVVRCALMIAIAGSVLSGVRSHAQDVHTEKSAALFVMTNSAERNEIISFRRHDDGSLERSRSFATGGRGTRRRHRSPGVAGLSHPKQRPFTTVCDKR